MDNGIPLRENEEQSLRHLAAKRQFYARAKGVARLQFAAVVCVPVGLILLDFYHPSARVWVAFVGLILTLADEAILNRWKSSLRRTAARIQEGFDNYVLSMEWSDMADPPVDREDLLGPSAMSADRGQLTNWYPVLVGSVSLAQGRIICQRANCVWDSRQRRFYGIATVITAVVVSIALVTFALACHLSLPDFVLSVLAPAFPFLMWSIRQSTDHYSAANRLEQMCHFSDRLWKVALEHTQSDEQLELESRRLQDAIYRHRESSPLISEWFYKLLRGRLQATLALSTEEMVQEVTSHRR